MDDDDLIKRCCKGDKKAWDDFVDQYSRLIYDIIHRCFRKHGVSYNDDTVNELFNEVFVHIAKENYKALRAFTGRNNCKFSTYLWPIVYFRTIDELRKLPPMHISLDEHKIMDIDAPKKWDVHNESNIEERIRQLDYEIMFEKIAHLLSDLEKKIIRLYFFEQQKPDFIAHSLNITVENFYNIKSRMLGKLRGIMEREEKA